MVRTALVPALVVAAAWTAGTGVAADPDLAERCEAVRWVPPGDGSTEMLPPGLRAIAEELRARGPSALPEIEAALERSRNLRRLASDVVQDWPCDRTRALLLRLLKDPDEAAACGAAFGPGLVGGAEVVGPLAEATRDPRGMVRHNALNSLSDVGGAAKALDGALACLADREAWVRSSAASLLSDVDWDEGVERVLPALEGMAARERDPETRSAAERAIRILRARIGK